MAFDSLTEKLQNVFKNLRSKGRLPEDDVKASAWLESPEKMEEDIITGLLEQEFIRSLTKPQLDVYTNCMRGNMSMLSYAKQNGLSFSTVKDTRDAIRKKFKKIF